MILCMGDRSAGGAYREIRREYMKKLTFAMENYLEAIYELSGGEKGARVSDIAKKLEGNKASTNSAMSTLAGKGLIVNEKYKEVFLTPAGFKLAEYTSKKHHVIQKFFTKFLNIDPIVADRDACAIEHVISSDSIRAIQKFMKRSSVKENPSHDNPHGSKEQQAEQQYRF